MKVTYITLTASGLISLPNGLFPSVFPTKILFAFLIYLTPCHHILQSSNIWWKVQIMKLLIMYFSPSSCFFLLHRSTYSLQYPVFKHPQFLFFPWGERPSFMPIQNKRWNWKTKNSKLNDSKHSPNIICSHFLHIKFIYILVFIEDSSYAN